MHARSQRWGFRNPRQLALFFCIGIAIGVIVSAAFMWWFVQAPEELSPPCDMESALSPGSGCFDVPLDSAPKVICGSFFAFSVRR